jgi:hypothetical protein
MSTIKISQLPALTVLNSNTSNTLFVGVDVPSDTTGKFTATTLAQGLFSNNALVVGQNPILLTNTVSQFSGTDGNYIQVNLQNFSNTGAGDMVITTDVGTNTDGFIDLGINNSQWNPFLYGQTSQYPLDGYLIVDGPGTTATGNLVIGTANPGTNLVFAVGGQFANNIVAKMTANGLVLNTQSYLTFADGTVQTTAASSSGFAAAAFAAANSAIAVNATQNNTISAAFTEANSAFIAANSAGVYANSAFAAANTAAANTVNLAGIELTQNTSITSAFAQANAAFNTANNALANTTGTFAGSLTITGNVSANYAMISNQLDFSSGNGTIATSSGSNNNKNLNLVAGNDVGGYQGGSITITSGNSTTTGGTGGNINLNAGTGNVTNGSVIVTGNFIANNVIQYNANVNNATVTQSTSKATAVTINGRTGQITTSNSNINKGTAATFTVNNNYIVSAKDVVIVNIASGASVGYALTVTSVTPGSFNICINNCDGTPSGSNAADTLVINFAIIRVA